jgi:D-sedoheptulose 7-phosphate isomerase
MRAADKASISTTSMLQHVAAYKENLSRALGMAAMSELPKLGEALRDAWRLGHTVYLCGNGGSAGNAIHLANDFLYGAGLRNGGGLRVEALNANPAVLTCLANDVGYDQIFAEQLKVKVNAGDVLIALSGSGNSENIIRALEVGNAKGMQTFAILGFSGGRCKNIAQHPIHFAIDDMQVAEDLQLIVGHICMQWLQANPVSGMAEQDKNIRSVLTSCEEIQVRS